MKLFKLADSFRLKLADEPPETEPPETMEYLLERFQPEEDIPDTIRDPYSDPQAQTSEELDRLNFFYDLQNRIVNFNMSRTVTPRETYWTEATPEETKYLADGLQKIIDDLEKAMGYIPPSAKGKGIG